MNNGADRGVAAAGGPYSNVVFLAGPAIKTSCVGKVEV